MISLFHVSSFPSFRSSSLFYALSLSQTSQLPNHGSLITNLVISTYRYCQWILHHLGRFSSQPYFDERWTTSNSSGLFETQRLPSRHSYNADRSETSSGRGSYSQRKSWKVKSSKSLERQTLSNPDTVRGSLLWRVKWLVMRGGRTYTRISQSDERKKVSFHLFLFSLCIDY